jgi:predicted permease
MTLDLRVAARTLRRSPGFALGAVVILAVGIGMNTALFSAMRATLLTDPPYPEHERLVVLDLMESSTARPGPPRAFPWSYPKFRMLRELELPLESSAAYAGRSFTITGAGAASSAAGEYATAEYFDVLGVTPAVGRFFTASEDEEGAPAVVVISHGFWEDRLGADPSAVGRSLTVEGRAFTIVGVTPPGFSGLTGRARLWLPVHGAVHLGAPFLVEQAQAHWLVTVARVVPDTDRTALSQRMSEAGRTIDEAWPDSDPTVVRGGAARSLAEARVNSEARTSLLVLAAGAGLLLLIACANLAVLLVARTSTRRREAAVRIALGGGRWSVARAFLSEALLLALGGGAAGVLIARVSLQSLTAIWPDRFTEAGMGVGASPVDTAGLDSEVLAFALVAALLTGLIFGVFPAMSASGEDPAERLRGSRATEGGGIWSVRAWLVGGQVALALVLLVSAGLLVRTLVSLQAVERGFDPEGLVTLRYALPSEGAWSDDPTAFHERYLERLQGLPGIESAANSCVAPLSGHCVITRVREAGGQRWGEGSRPSVGVNFVSDDFFRTLRIPVLSGRTFTSADQSDSRPVVVVSQRAAEELFPDGDALGSAIGFGTGLTPEDGTPAEVVGVVGDVLFDRPAAGVMAEVFVSHRQERGTGTVVARVRGDPSAALAGARAALAELDPDVPMVDVRTMSDLEARATGDTRLLSLLLTVFAGLSLLLACTGVWSVVSFGVARRRREIGLRVALGAEPGRVVRAMLAGGLRLTAAGLAVGVVAAWLGSQALRSVLFGVGPTDPVTFLGGGMLLLVVTVLAAWIPARSAARVDPMVVLRSE